MTSTPSDVLSVACPTCGELAGRRCVKDGSFGSLPVEPHPSRIAAASEQDRQINPDRERWERFAKLLTKEATIGALGGASNATESPMPEARWQTLLDIAAIARRIARGEP
jgi:hypothetical protein